MTETVDQINTRLRAKYLPQPQPPTTEPLTEKILPPVLKRGRGRPPNIRGYDLVSSLLKEGPLKASKKYNLDYAELRARSNKLNQKLEKRRIKGCDRWWVGRCEVKGCLGFWIVDIDKKDEISNTSLCCPFHYKRKKRIFRLSGRYGRRQDLWRMSKHLRNGLFWDMIKHLIPRDYWKAVYAFFIDGKTDPGAIARQFDLKSQEEAERIIIHASIILRQALKCLTTKVNEMSWRPITYWGARHRDLHKNIQNRQFTSMKPTACDKRDYGKQWVTPKEI